LTRKPPLAWTVIIAKAGDTKGILRWGIALENRSPLLLEVEVEVVTGDINGIAVSPDVPEGRSLVLPDSEITVWCPPIPSFPAAPDEVTGTLSYKVRYGSPEHFPKFRLNHSFRFTRNKQLNGDFREMSHDLEGPSHDVSSEA
ncbi:MAG: hypothetical protein ACREXY_16790, partial [Gammaproteobacteria bacterium]